MDLGFIPCLKRQLVGMRLDPFLIPFSAAIPRTEVLLRFHRPISLFLEGLERMVSLARCVNSKDHTLCAVTCLSAVEPQ